MSDVQVTVLLEGNPTYLTEVAEHLGRGGIHAELVQPPKANPNG